MAQQNIYDQFDEPKAPAAPMTVGTPRAKDHFVALPKNDPRYRPDYPSAQFNELTGQVDYGPQLKPDPTTKEDIGALRANITNVIDKALEAREKSRNGWFATGFGADLANKIGGTTAADVKGLIDTISANTAFETLQKMREASPTGGALGAISERELDLLRSTISSPQQSQSDDQFQKSMWEIANAYGRVLAKLPGGRQIMIQRGWLPKAAPQKAKPKADNGIKFLGFE